MNSSGILTSNYLPTENMTIAPSTVGNLSLLKIEQHRSQLGKAGGRALYPLHTASSEVLHQMIAVIIASNPT